MDPLPTPPAEPEPLPQHIVEPSHAPGQVIGPTAAGGADIVPPGMQPTPDEPALNLGTPLSSELTMPTDPNERPTAVALPSQATSSVINGQIIGQNETRKSPLKRMGKRPMLIFLFAPLLLLGGSAAAYFGYVVPNKPQNILAKAFSNSLEQQQVTTIGTLDSTSNGVSAKIDYTAAADEAAHSVDLKINATVSGVKIPLELIFIKNNLYFKIGDLSSLEGLLSQFAGTSNADLKTLEDQINKSITNQWIVVDSTLIKEAKLDCLGGFPASFSSSDIQALKDSYKAAPFVTVSSHSADKVNGASATKYQISIDDDTLAKFDLNGTGYFKNLISCLKTADPASNLSLSSLKDGDKTPLTIWVDRSSKRIVKYAAQSTAKDKSKGVEGDFSGTITYDKVNITQPANSKPVLNLLNELNLNSLFNAGSSSPKTTGSGLPTILN